MRMASLKRVDTFSDRGYAVADYQSYDHAQPGHSQRQQCARGKAQWRRGCMNQLGDAERANHCRKLFGRDHQAADAQQRGKPQRDDCGEQSVRGYGGGCGLGAAGLLMLGGRGVHVFQDLTLWRDEPALSGGETGGMTSKV